jgi:hypothetical protein
MSLFDDDGYLIPHHVRDREMARTGLKYCLSVIAEIKQQMRDLVLTKRRVFVMLKHPRVSSIWGKLPDDMFEEIVLRI